VVAAKATSKDGSSSGVAVASRLHIGLGKSAAGDLPVSEQIRNRFGIVHVEGGFKGGFHLATIYCHTKIGIKAKSNLDLLEEAGACLRTLNGPWVLCGDFNCTPADIRDTGWTDVVKGAVHAPPTPTCNDKTYDFFIVSRDISHAVRRVSTV
jgi:endonuclease/exonuclease/phosphatase family metal-dependent hydrolase